MSEVSVPVTENGALAGISPQSPAQTENSRTKISPSPQIQTKVDERKFTLKQKYPNADDALINEQARSRIAAELRIERLKRDVEKNKGKAITDKLTGALNGTGFEEIMQLEGRRTIRSGKPMVIVVLDANDLKIKNEAGHSAGDEYLKKISRALQKASRASDVLGRQSNSEVPEGTPRVARWGGDEFGVILDSTDIEGGKSWWNRASIELEAEGVSIGAGMQILNPSDIAGKTPGEMSAIISDKKHEADMAMMGISKPDSKTQNKPVLTVYSELTPEVVASLPARIAAQKRAA